MFETFHLFFVLLALLILLLAEFNLIVLFVHFSEVAFLAVGA
jgi:hypothetical protein